MRRVEIRAAAAGMDDPAVESLYRQGSAEVRHALDESPRIGVRAGVAFVRPFVEEGVRLLAREEAILAAATSEEKDLLDQIQENARSIASVYVAVQNLVAKHAPKPLEPAPPPPKPDIRILDDKGEWKPWPPPAA